MSILDQHRAQRLQNPYRGGVWVPVFLFQTAPDQHYAVDIGRLHESDELLAAFLPEKQLEIRTVDGFAYAILFLGVVSAFLISPIICASATLISAIILAANKRHCGEHLAARAMAEPGVFVRMYQSGLVWRLSSKERRQKYRRRESRLDTRLRDAA